MIKELSGDAFDHQIESIENGIRVKQFYCPFFWYLFAILYIIHHVAIFKFNFVRVMNSIKFLWVFIFIVFSYSSIAQQGIHSSGGNASGPGGTASYSIGQVFYSSQSGTNGTLIQGVQQPYELMVTEVKDFSSSRLICEAYPNPALKELNLRISGEQPENGSWKLIDTKGVAVLSGKISSKETLIPMVTIPTASYTLQIFSGKRELKIFKIVKQ